MQIDFCIVSVENKNQLWADYELSMVSVLSPKGIVSSKTFESAFESLYYQLASLLARRKPIPRLKHDTIEKHYRAAGN